MKMSKKIIRKEREKIVQELNMVKAAEKLFFKNGYESTTMDQIALKAEYSKATLYNHFKSKEQIFLSVIDYKLELFQKNLINNIKREITLESKLKSLIHIYLDFFIKNNQLFKIVHSEQFKLEDNSGTDYKSLLKHKFRKHIESISNLFQESSLNESQTEFLAVLIHSILSGVLTYHFLFKKGNDIKILENNIFEYVKKLIK